jgi:hypothetical protein
VSSVHQYYIMTSQEKDNGNSTVGISSSSTLCTFFLASF